MEEINLLRSTNPDDLTLQKIRDYMYFHFFYFCFFLFFNFYF